MEEPIFRRIREFLATAKKEAEERQERERRRWRVLAERVQRLEARTAAAETLLADIGKQLHTMQQELLFGVDDETLEGIL